MRHALAASIALTIAGCTHAQDFVPLPEGLAHVTVSESHMSDATDTTLFEDGRVFQMNRTDEPNKVVQTVTRLPVERYAIAKKAALVQIALLNDRIEGPVCNSYGIDLIKVVAADGSLKVATAGCPDGMMADSMAAVRAIIFAEGEAAAE